MLFASFDFLLFFVPIFLLYWGLAGKVVLRFGVLLLGSYFFYAASARPPGGALPTPWYFAGLLGLSTLVDYGCALSIARSERSGVRNLWLGVSLVTNLGLLGYFKYTGFLLEVTSALAQLAGLQWAMPSFHVLLPIGISFYTFQSLSYTIDVWRRRLTPERSLLRFALYVSFFPQLVAGPIVRASEFLPQLHQRQRLSAEDLNFALWRITKGLIKKVLLGDFIAAFFTDLVFASPGDYSTLENLLALYAFTLQIYADFSGYTDIAIGVARLLGFRLPENFDRPYQSRDIGEFWRRWHMTLSTWLRDYLFFPLGGSRGTNARTYVNLWITMFLVGMWHGASWNFLVYSNLQAGAMLFNRFHRVRGGSLNQQLLKSLAVAGLVSAFAYGLLSLLDTGDVALWWSLALGVGSLLVGWLPHGKLWMPLHVLLTFHFSVLSRVFFRADDWSKAKLMVSKLLEFDGLGVREGLFRIQGAEPWLSKLPRGFQPWFEPLVEWGFLWLLLFGLGYHFTPARWLDVRGLRWISRQPAPILALVIALVFVGISSLLSGPRANIYFAF